MRRRALLEAIEEHIGDRAIVSGDGSGTHIVLWPRKRIPEEALIARAAQEGVGVYGISGYFLKRSSRVGLLLGYCRMREHEIHEGIRRLAKAIP